MAQTAEFSQIHTPMMTSPRPMVVQTSTPGLATAQDMTVHTQNLASPHQMVIHSPPGQMISPAAGFGAVTPMNMPPPAIMNPDGSKKQLLVVCELARFYYYADAGALETGAPPATIPTRLAIDNGMCSSVKLLEDTPFNESNRVEVLSEENGVEEARDDISESGTEVIPTRHSVEERDDAEFKENKANESLSEGPFKAPPSAKATTEDSKERSGWPFKATNNVKPQSLDANSDEQQLKEDAKKSEEHLPDFVCNRKEDNLKGLPFVIRTSSSIEQISAMVESLSTDHSRDSRPEMKEVVESKQEDVCVGADGMEVNLKDYLAHKKDIIDSEVQTRQQMIASIKERIRELEEKKKEINHAGQVEAIQHAIKQSNVRRVQNLLRSFRRK